MAATPSTRLEPAARLELLRIARPEASATFLPKVWDQFGEPRDFVRQLKLKAGWDPGFWSQEIEVWRYDTELISQT